MSTSGEGRGGAAPRTRLDRDSIVAAACALADREGTAAMTMRRLGAELGVDPTAVYRYFPSKRDLLAAVADELFAGMQAQLPAGGAWRDNVRAMLELGFGLYRAHPELAVQLARQRDDSPALVSVADAMIRELRAAGLSERDAATTYHTLVDVIVGVGLYYASDPELSDEQSRAAIRRTYAALPPETYPDAVAVAPHLYPVEDVIFESTVALLLDGIEQRVRGEDS